jgi:hypothetical protein
LSSASLLALSSAGVFQPLGIVISMVKGFFFLCFRLIY